MSSYDKKMNALAIAKAFADMGAALGYGKPGGAWGQKAAESASNLAQGLAAEETERKRKEEEESGLGGSVGAILGTVLGTAVGGPVGGMIGGGLGSAGGQLAGGGKVNFGNVAKSAVAGGLSGGMGAGTGAAAGSTAGAVADTATKAATTAGSTAATAVPGITADSILAGVSTPVGTNTVLAPAAASAGPVAQAAAAPFAGYGPLASPPPIVPSNGPPITPPSQLPQEPSFLNRLTSGIMPALQAQYMVNGFMNGGGMPMYGMGASQQPKRYVYKDGAWVGEY